MGISQSTIEKYVGVAKEVTGLTPTILYNSEEKMYYTLSLSITNEYSDLLSERLGDLMGFLTGVDVMDQDVLENMLITIPTGIFTFGLTDSVRESFLAVEESIGYRFKSDEERYLFAILHEFGHYHDLMVNNKEDYLGYFAESERQSDYYAYSDKDDATYRRLEMERYADHYALTHLQESLQRLHKEELLYA
jgi:hypothetical protein